MIMTDNYIQINEEYSLKIGIKDSKGNDTGDFLVFDLMDPELMLRLQEADKQHKKNYNYYLNQCKIIDNKEDHKGKFLLSSNQVEKIKAQLDFFEKEEKALDLFLGEGGTKKILHGRKFNEFTFNQIVEEISPILPLLKENHKMLIKKIKEKYKTKDKEVLE